MWQGRYKAKLVEDQRYLDQLLIYIHLNPVVAGIVGVEIADLQSRRRSEELVRARELLMILGVERYSLKVKDLAAHLRKSPDGMTQTIARAAIKRTKDTPFRRELNKLDIALSKVEG